MGTKLFVNNIYILCKYYINIIWLTTNLMRGCEVEEEDIM